MERGDNSENEVKCPDQYEDEIYILEAYEGEKGVETHGITTHFWLERTYRDKTGTEKCQCEQEISRKLWSITSIFKLEQV